MYEALNIKVRLQRVRRRGLKRKLEGSHKKVDYNRNDRGEEKSEKRLEMMLLREPCGE